MKINYKKLSESAKEPFFATQHAAGADLCASKKVIISPFEPTLIPLGVAIEIPKGYMGILALRSSTPRKNGLFIPNGLGIIDSDYRGELFMQCCALKEQVVVEVGDRIAQLIIIPTLTWGDTYIGGMNEVETLSKTVRGTGGFGSTN